MPDYNFSNLSPYDFELLVRDLLQRSENLRFRAFAPGRDGGVDLRAWKSEQRRHAVIVQCKNTPGSTFSMLRTRAGEERVKLDQLRHRFTPERYLLATTQSLTAANIDELFSILAPYCKSTDDILDIAAIEVLLAADEATLRKHYKLWITSTAILDRILHAGVYNRSESYKAGVIARSKVFVRTAALERARQILEEHHTLIISGLPGVGKTTLADMICLDYLAQDFDLVAISEDVTEADELYSASAKQIFVYDDFLGRSDPTERMGKNEDARLIDFMRRIQATPNHRFVLTTREYLLRFARNKYERIDNSDVDALKYTLEMRDYTAVQKGLILYQHIAFADYLDQEEVRSFIRDRQYVAVIEHPNYTPRHIADALNEIRRNRRTEAARPLAMDFLAVLDNPAQVWTHALRQVSRDAQRLFLSLAVLPDSITESDLRNAFTSQKTAQAESFLDLLRALDDSFIAIDRGDSGERLVRFKNPSLGDFAHAYIDLNVDWADIILSAPIFFAQIIRVFMLAIAKTITGKAKHPNILAWTQPRSQRLFDIASDLAVTDQSSTDGPRTSVLRLSQLISLIQTFTIVISGSTASCLRSLIESSLDPPEIRAAEDVLDLVRDYQARHILDDLLGADFASSVRANMLDKGEWKFPILRELDKVTGLDPTSTEVWGMAYVQYATRLSDDLVDSFDLYRIRQATMELRTMADFLDLDFGHEIDLLTDRQNWLEREEDDDDYDGAAEEGSSASLGDAVHLDRVFGSLITE